MFPRWLWFNHVPAGLRLSPQEYARVKQVVRAMSTGQRRFSDVSRRMLARLAPGCVLLALAFAVWLLYLISVRPGSAWWPAVHALGVLMFLASLWVLIAWSMNRAMAPVVWRALNQCGFRVCEGCGYMLDGLPRAQSHCPECGAPLRPPIEPGQLKRP